MIFEIRRGRACDSVVRIQEKFIQAGLQIEQELDKQIQNKQNVINLLRSENLVWEQRLENQFQYTKELQKQNKKLKTFLGIGGVLLIVAVIL